MVQISQDPTVVLPTFILHAIYAWDEAPENLYEHVYSLVSCIYLVVGAIHSDLRIGKPSMITTAEMSLTQELHVIRAHHHLHYLSLLEHCTKHVLFIKTTSNPVEHAGKTLKNVMALVSYITKFVRQIYSQSRS